MGARFGGGPVVIDPRPGASVGEPKGPPSPLAGRAVSGGAMRCFVDSFK